MFYRTLLFLFLALALARADEPVPQLPDYAGIYPTNGTVPTIGLLASLAPGAKIVESKDKDITVLRCDWPDVSVTIRVDPHWDHPGQILEMNRWITYLSKDQKDNPIIKNLMKKLETTKNCFGCVITPRFDPNDKAVGLLLALAANTDGLIYANHTFYDEHGNRIFGVEGDPVRMQYTK